jgi:hypothetical protein
MSEHDDAHRIMDPEHADEREAGQLTKQTPGLDGEETSAIAGPDWDPELVDDARRSMGGTPLEGEIERGTEPGE